MMVVAFVVARVHSGIVVTCLYHLFSFVLLEHVILGLVVVVVLHSVVVVRHGVCSVYMRKRVFCEVCWDRFAKARPG